MSNILFVVLQFLNQWLSAGIAITAFSLLLYALTFNLRDRVARSFALILSCVVIVSFCDAIISVSRQNQSVEFWLRFQWVGLLYLPSAYFHFSDAILATTGKPSRGRRRWLVRINYLLCSLFVLILPFPWLVGLQAEGNAPAPHLQGTWFSSLFTAYYVGLVAWSWYNIWRAYKRTVTPTGQRRMRYLLIGSLAPALGLYPYLLFGSGLAAALPVLFWFITILNDLLMAIFMVVMAYSVAFFGVSWPDRVVKDVCSNGSGGPFTVSLVLALTTLVRRFGNIMGLLTRHGGANVSTSLLIIGMLSPGCTNMGTLAFPWRRP
jgi:hypothetical protein